MSDIRSSGGGTSRLPALELDPSLYTPTSEETGFLKSQTGIEDEEELRQHVLTIQKEAWNVVNYKCIQTFMFLWLKISRLPVYQDLLRLGRERPGAIFLDYACFFGSDVRKAIADGYPMENVIASDLQQEFWELGHRLYKTTSETFPVPFVQGNIFDPRHISPTPPFYSSPPMERPSLSTLKSLTPLQGHISAIHVTQLFHLFNREDQIKAARALASLLSPSPGSMIFGSHQTTSVSNDIIHPESAGGVSIYCFSPEDWRALWDGVIFKKGTVSVKAELVEASDVLGREIEYKNATEEQIRRPMAWCVKRI